MRLANLRLVACVVLSVGGQANAAQVIGDVTFDATQIEVDLRNDVLQLNGEVHVIQGLTSLQSERATAHALQSPRSKWTFNDAVHIKTADADLKSDVATAAFIEGKIATAVAKGTPAYFEQRRGTPDKLVSGHAGTIDYDVTRGIVKLTDQVSFSYGGNEFRGNVVVYNIRDERVTVNPTGQDNGRVNITIKPKSLDKKSTGQTGQAPTPPASGRKDGA